MSFTRYPEYKDSGVEWLGEVPGHWEVDRLKASLVSSRNGIWGDEAKGDENDIPCVRVADFDRQQLRVQDEIPTIRSVTEKERQERLLSRGNLLLEKSGGGENQPVGCVVLYDSDTPAVCSNFVARIELKSEMCPEYWRYVHAAAYAVRLTVGSINQTSGIQNLDQNRYFNERAPFPPLAEQTAIATFLDHETAKIDALVAEQEKLIALLQEKRQAVISHAVTKGLNPNVPMKDSGVEWLGEVPGHWGVSALSYLSSIETGSTPDRTEPRYWNGSIPWIKTGEINWEPIREAEESITEDGLEESAVKLSKPGTILMAMYGQGVTRGRVALLEIEATYNQACAAINFDSRVLPTYGRYFFMAAYDHIREGGNETSQMNLSASLIAKFRFTVPSLHEQTAITKFLDEKTTKIDALMTQIRTVIRLLQERRTALISAAVTGQIDVRGWAGAANQ
jgi:type I restriction enzyme S subunit